MYLYYNIDKNNKLINLLLPLIINNILLALLLFFTIILMIIILVNIKFLKTIDNSNSRRLPGRQLTH
jgi:hypothetical protein